MSIHGIQCRFCYSLWTVHGKIKLLFCRSDVKKRKIYNEVGDKSAVDGRLLVESRLKLYTSGRFIFILPVAVSGSELGLVKSNIFIPKMFCPGYLFETDIFNTCLGTLLTSSVY